MVSCHGDNALLELLEQLGLLFGAVHQRLEQRQRAERMVQADGQFQRVQNPALVQLKTNQNRVKSGKTTLTQH